MSSNKDSFEYIIEALEQQFGQKISPDLATELETICKSYPEFLAFYSKECFGESVFSAIFLFFNQIRKRKPNLAKIVLKMHNSNPIFIYLFLGILFITAMKSENGPKASKKLKLKLKFIPDTIEEANTTKSLVSYPDPSDVEGLEEYLSLNKLKNKRTKKPKPKW